MPSNVLAGNKEGWERKTMHALRWQYMTNDERLHGRSQ
jgi:hypothetical protein